MWRIKKRNKGIGYRGEGIGKQKLTPNPYTLYPVKGFTLIELLVATSILGMIGAAILATFGSGFQVYERVQAYGRTQTDVFLSLEAMEADLKNTFPLSGIDFIGEAKKISFPGLIAGVDNQGNPGTSLGKISYYLDSQKKTLVKEKQEYPLAVSSSPPQESGLETLASLEDIQFDYYYFDPETERYDWKSDWDLAQEGMPIGVKIKVTFLSAEQQSQIVRTVLIPARGTISGEQEGEEEGEGEGEGES